jgi:biotin/methionine sulfoxide reductase
VIMLQAFREDPDRHPLPTPSGKIEIFSQTISDFGLTDCPGHPTWIPPPEWLGAEKAKTCPLHLISDQPSRKLHSQLDHGRSSMDAKIGGREAVTINPADAGQKGITDGAVVELFNERGRVIAAARVSDGIMPGVVRLSTGAWYDPDGNADRHGNPNALTLDRGASGLSQGCAAQTCLVDIRPCAEPPAVRAHRLPSFAEREEPHG